MPIYKYVCEKCGSQTEVIQKISDPPRKRCEKCRGKLTKEVSRTSFQLKGSGWYATDYPRSETAAVKDKAGKSVDKSDKSVEKTEKPSEKKADTVSKTSASADKD